jgi:uncharacterized membrane protein
MILVDYIKFLVIYIVIDMVWVIGAGKMHSNMVEKVQKKPLKVNLLAASLYYLMAPLLYIFVIKPYAKTTSDVLKIAITCSLLMFGTFDLTNRAIFQDYSWSYTAMDISWGVFSITLACFLTYKIK